MITPGRAAAAKLPFMIDIPVRSYLDHAIPLSIVADNPDHVACLLGSFIQLFFPDDKGDFDRVIMHPGLRLEDWQSLGFVRIESLTVGAMTFADRGAFLDLLVEKLDAGRYIDVCIDEYFLPGRPGYHNTHSVHDNALVGYDLQAQTFDLAGYGSDYELSTVAFDDVVQAFFDAPLRQSLARRVNAVARCPAPARSFDPTRVRAQLLDYLNGSATVAPDAMRSSPPYRRARRFHGRWGIETYGAFAAYFQGSARQGRPLDLRTTRTLWEHKACMLRRLDYLHTEGYLATGGELARAYAAVEALARSVRFGAFEYNLDPTTGVDRMVDDVLAMRAAEKPVLDTLLSSWQEA